VIRLVYKISVLSTFVFLSSCQDGTNSLFPKAERPIPHKLILAMKAKGMTSRSPIVLRIFKEESTLEVWKEKDTGRFDLLETYEICKWSGKLGPKFKEGDRQAPEGFYTVAPAQMNPKSQYHLSFNMGYPNLYDRSNKRTGTHLMVHGACSSAGCYSMTDELVEEIYSLARESFKGGQRKFQIQALPFRMTPENMVRHENNNHYEFWKMLKKGNDHFEVTKYPPKIDVCDKNYVFNRTPEGGGKFHSTRVCPSSTVPENLQSAYLKKVHEDNLAMSEYRKKVAQKENLGKLLGKKDLGQIENIGNSTIVQVNPVPGAISNTPRPTVVVPQPRPDLIAGKLQKKSKGLFSWLRR
jgi:murein L,D-transpeptidase YafK